MSLISDGFQVTSSDEVHDKAKDYPENKEHLQHPIILNSSDILYSSKSQIIASPSSSSPNFVTDDTSYRMSQGSQNLISNNSSGKSFSSREKALSIALGLVSVLCIALMIAVVIVGLQLNKDDYSPTPKPTTVTPLPPWVTTQSTTPGSGCETTDLPGTISPRPTTTRPPTILDAAEVCLTTECIHTASKILTSLDENVDPCDDFYQFACGGWIKENPIPESESHWGHFSILNEKMVYSIRDILESKPQSGDPEPLQISQIYYKACLEQESGESPLLHQLMEDVGIKSENDSKNANSLGVILGKIRRIFGGNYLFTLQVREDEKDGSVNTIYLDQPQFGLLPAYLLDKEGQRYVEAYTELMQNIWTDFFPGDDIKSIVDNVIGFEKALANISAIPTARRNKTEMYNTLTIEDLHSFVGNSTVSSIDWMNYLEEVFQDVIHGNSSFKLENSTPIVINDLKFFEQMESVLSETNEETIINYLKWRILLDFADEAEETYRNYVFNYVKKLFGNESRKPRWKTCSSQTEVFLSMAISYRYVQDRFTDENYREFISKFEGIVDGIKSSFLEVLDEIDWIADNETRRVAKEKAENMKTFIGFPEWLMDKDHAGLLKHYKGLVLSNSSSHLQSYLDANHWTSWKRLKRITENNDGKRWVMSPITINAAYDPNANSITVPIGLLQPPFYADFGNDTITPNYGALGAIVGHEITHAFDDIGRQNDEHGNLRDWWDSETLANYIERDTCFQKQYGRFSEEILGNNVKVNGLNTLGENIADNGGVREAYSALLRHAARTGEDKTLPGISYSQDQLFFISYAQVWCASSTPETLNQLFNTDVHSPAKFRVKGVVENSEAFSYVWSCPRPADAKICKIWG